MAANWVRRHSGFVALALAFGLGACSTETVYVDKPTYNPPPDSAGGFLGYYAADTNQTTCGNCHVGQQQDWSQTVHSGAWAALASIGQDGNAACQGCHSVNSRGNQPFANVGYDSVKSDLYHDVQCESCHGPGLNHVKNPTVVANRPIPSMLIYPNQTTTTVATAQDTADVINSGCGSCHTDEGTAKHHNYLKEWLSSRHGKLNMTPAPRVECQPCHEGKGALAAWGVNTIYKEQGTTTLLPQNCVVCHDPHGTAKGADGKPLLGQLRFPITEPVLERNLCTHCHNRTAEPAANNSRGPHGAQGPVVFGTAGYFPPGTVYDTTAILTTHGSSANPRLCAGCHVNKQTGVDANGNSVTFTGHSFHPLPCLQQKSPPVVDTTYDNSCAYDEPSRSYAACTASGCHGTEAVALSRLTGIWNEKEDYLKVLWVDLNGNQKVDAFPTDTGYLAKVMLNAPNDLNFTTPPYSTTMTAAKGALFNAQLTGEELTGHPDGSHGVHNPFLYRALLQSSIADMLANYPGFLPAPPAPVLSQIQAAIRSGQLKVAPRTERAVMAPTTLQVAGTR
jgi:cytochrome c554/c'-like protein